MSLEDDARSIYIKRDGTPIRIDTSDEACFPYGFRHGCRVITPKGKGTVVGEFMDNLWFQLDDENGKVSYWGALKCTADASAKEIYPTGECCAPYDTTHYELMAIKYNERKQESNSNDFHCFPTFLGNIFKNALNTLKSKNQYRSSGRDIISLLPSEIVVEICKFCLPLQVFMLSLMSKSWRKIFTNKSIWKYYCEYYRVPCNDAVLRGDYRNDYISYFFSRGIPKVHTFEIADETELDRFNDTHYRVGDLYWHFVSNRQGLRFEMKGLSIGFIRFVNIIVTFDVKIVDTITNVDKIYQRAFVVNGFNSKIRIFDYRKGELVWCQMTVRISPVLMTLMYYKVIGES